MKILVTGATGFIGAAVARKLSQQRHEVMALSRSDAAAAKLRAAGLTPIAGDFANPASLAAPAAQVDAVVSTASIGQVEGTPESFAKDRDAVEVMTKALGDSGKPLIFTSGSAIFGVFTRGEASPTIFDEEHPVPLPASVFAPPEAEIPPPFIAASPFIADANRYRPGLGGNCEPPPLRVRALLPRPVPKLRRSPAVCAKAACR